MIEEDNTLIIKKLRMDDSGMYQCWARNNAGEDSISTWLKVKSECNLYYLKRLKVTINV